MAKRRPVLSQNTFLTCFTLKLIMFSLRQGHIEGRFRNAFQRNKNFKEKKKNEMNGQKQRLLRVKGFQGTNDKIGSHA